MYGKLREIVQESPSSCTQLSFPGVSPIFFYHVLTILLVESLTLRQYHMLWNALRNGASGQWRHN